MDDPRFQAPAQGNPFNSEYDFDSGELSDLISRDVAAVQVQTLDLSSAGILEIDIPGRAAVLFDYLTSDSLKSPLGQAIVNVSLNNQGDASFPMRNGRGINASFVKLYLSWPAQSGLSCDFVIYKSRKTPWFDLQ